MVWFWLWRSRFASFDWQLQIRLPLSSVNSEGRVWNIRLIQVKKTALHLRLSVFDGDTMLFNSWWQSDMEGTRRDKRWWAGWNCWPSPHLGTCNLETSHSGGRHPSDMEASPKVCNYTGWQRVQQHMRAVSCAYWWIDLYNLAHMETKLVSILHVWPSLQHTRTPWLTDSC